jgi:SSS family solute:Na+ symporter
MVGTTGFKSTTYPLHLGALTVPGYAALYSLVGNFVVAIVLTVVFQLLKAPAGADATIPEDYLHEGNELVEAEGAHAIAGH